MVVLVLWPAITVAVEVPLAAILPSAVFPSATTLYVPTGMLVKVIVPPAGALSEAVYVLDVMVTVKLVISFIWYWAVLAIPVFGRLMERAVAEAGTEDEVGDGT